jgi:uncharacterized protein (DUF2062 family)
MSNWLRRRVIEPLLALLRQGMAPDRLALCVALGIVIGNIPILGLSTVLCTAIALVFRLNLPAIQLVQAAMAPSQLLLIIPFVRLGEWIVQAPPQAVSVKEGMTLVSQGVLHAVVVLWQAILHAGLAWLLVAPLVTVVLHRVFTRVFQRVAARITTRGIPVSTTAP